METECSERQRSFVELLGRQQSFAQGGTWGLRLVCWGQRSPSSREKVIYWLSGFSSGSQAPQSVLWQVRHQSTSAGTKQQPVEGHYLIIAILHES